MHAHEIMMPFVETWGTMEHCKADIAIGGAWPLTYTLHRAHLSS